MTSEPWLHPYALYVMSVHCFISVITISQGQLLNTYQVWGLEYTIEFDIMVKKVPTEWTNVFLFTNTMQSMQLQQYGLRTPCVNLEPNVAKLEFASAINSNLNYVFKYDYTLNQYHHVIIKQFKNDESYTYAIEIDSETVLFMENNNAQQFYKVSLYASDPWTSPFDYDIGILKNFEAGRDGSSRNCSCHEPPSHWLSRRVE